MMLAKMTLFLLTAMAVGVLSDARPASAITVELAKKCRQMALKAHPTARTGTRQESARAQQDYYRICVARNGKMD